MTAPSSNSTKTLSNIINWKTHTWLLWIVKICRLSFWQKFIISSSEGGGTSLASHHPVWPTAAARADSDPEYLIVFVIHFLCNSDHTVGHSQGSTKDIGMYKETCMNRWKISATDWWASFGNFSPARPASALPHTCLLKSFAFMSEECSKLICTRSVIFFSHMEVVDTSLH